MTNPFDNKKLTKEKLLQLIISAKKLVHQDSAAVNTTEFNWERPHHFRPDNLQHLEFFCQKRLTHFIEKTFASLCHGETKITNISIDQNFACKLSEVATIEYENYYFLSYSINNKVCGFISISPDTAVALVGHMLRDSETSPEDGKDLSLLEESILYDIVSAITDSLAEAFIENGGLSIEIDSNFVKGKWPLKVSGLEDLTSIRFTAEHSNGAVDISFTMISNILDPLVGAKNPNTEDLSAQSISNMIMQRMHNIPISVTSQICSASISLNDLMNLNKGDVLLLNKKISEPFDILLNDHSSLKGYLASSHGKYAMAIAAPEKNSLL